MKPPSPPDDAILVDAEEMVAKASDASAGEMAPDALLEARRHLTSARAVLYRAASDDRQLTDAESRRIDRLADKAYLDARLAFVRTQAEAVRRKVAELTAEFEGGTAADAEVTP